MPREIGFSGEFEPQTEEAKDVAPENKEENTSGNDPLGLFTDNPTPEQIAEIDSFAKELQNLDNEKSISTVSRFFNNVKNNITNYIKNIATSKDEILEEYERTLDPSIQLGKRGATLFDHSSKTGLTPTDIEYTHTQNKGSLDFEIDHAKKIFGILKKSASKRKLKEFVADKKDSMFARKDLERGNYSHESEEVENVKTLKQRVPIDGTSLLICEDIASAVLKESNLTIAHLMIADKNSGRVLDLDQLLPEGFRYVPGDMAKASRVLNHETLKYEYKFDFSDLSKYNGVQHNSGEFYASSNTVSYGNLTDKGARLILLHEIAHAWQRKHISHSGKKNYTEFSEQVTRILRHFEVFPDEFDDEDKQFIRERQKENLQDLGVEIDMDNYTYEGQDINEREYKLSSLGVDHTNTDGPTKLKNYQFLVRSEKIKPLVEDFVREERDAWAHAIKVLRFLRKQGLDLEPELQTPEDFKNLVHNALGTYQTLIESQVDPTKHIRKFTKQSRYIPETPQENS